jgi:NADH-quinone oxidoreductase subunit M
MLPMVQRMIFNPLDRAANRDIPDLNARELVILVPLVAAIFWIGIYPRPILDRMEPAAMRVINEVNAGRFIAAPAVDGTIEYATPEDGESRDRVSTAETTGRGEARLARHP